MGDLLIRIGTGPNQVVVGRVRRNSGKGWVASWRRPDGTFKVIARNEPTRRAAVHRVWVEVLGDDDG
jgi:prenyltransferase beta subunit